MQTRPTTIADLRPGSVASETSGLTASVRCRELLVVAGITIVAFLIRVWRINECGLSHFDAGIYAQSGLWPWTGQFQFQQGYFSPPLYPLLVGMANLALIGPTDWAGVLVSSIASTLIVPVAWWIARDWWNPFAGILASLLLCFSGMQIVFARVGLTDALFSLLFLAGLAACRTAIAVGGWRRIVMAGVLVGLAWNTKYNGFLPLVLTCGFLFRSMPWLPIIRLAQISSIAISLYLPWAIWFHVQHGYWTLIEHQRGYTADLGKIPGNLAKALFAMIDAREPEIFIPALIVTGITLIIYRRLFLASLVLAITIMFMFTLINFSILILAVLLILASGVYGCRLLSDRIGLAWTLACLVLLPATYTPYLRLWLPTETIALMTVAGACGSLVAWSRRRPPAVGNWVLKSIPLVIAIPLAILAILVFIRNGALQKVLADEWRPSSGYRIVASEIADFTGKNARVFSMGRWPMNYYLILQGIDVHPLSGEPWDITQLRRGDYLVVDRARFDTPSFRSTLDRATRELSIHMFNSVEPDQATLLDDKQRYFDPDSLPPWAKDPPPLDYSVLIFHRD